MSDDDDDLYEPTEEDRKAYRESVRDIKIDPPPKSGNGKRDGFIRNPESERILARHDNVVTALGRLGIRLRYNEFSGRIELTGLPGYGPELDDPVAIRIRFKMVEMFGFTAPRALVEDSLTDIARAHSYHPVRDYLASLRWDETPRVDAWLITYGAAEDTPFNRAVGPLMLIAAVRRVRQPGCKFDTMPVFESSEGKNKSQALRIMAVRDEWFSDSMGLGVSPREAIEQTAGKWIVEIGELHGLSTREEGRIKAFLSRQEDRAREAYGHFARTVGRRCIYVGTTNEDDYLKAEGRRILPIKVKLFDLVALRKDRDQLWAEAAKREADGESIILAENLWITAAEARADRVQENPFYSRLKERFGDTSCISSKAVWEYLGIPDTEKDRVSKRVGQAMRLLGFERHQCKANGQPLTGLKRDDRYYERPPEDGTG